MSQNTQTPLFFTPTNASNNVLTISTSRAVSIYTSGGATRVTNVNSQTIDIPNGTTMSIVADSGNTLSNIVVTPQTGATAYVTILGGNASMV